MKPVFNFIFCYCKATCFLSLWRLHSSLNVESKSVSLKSLFWFSDTRFLQDVAGRCAQQPALQSTVKHQNRKHKQESFISEHNKQRAHTLIFKHLVMSVCESWWFPQTQTHQVVVSFLLVPKGIQSVATGADYKTSTYIKTYSKKHVT